jgi:nucleoid DNA-binding protein
MNKSELIKEIAGNLDGVSQTTVLAVLDEMKNIVKETVKAGEKVTISGFLNFEKKHIDAKSGTIHLGAQKGETWENPAKDVLAVKPSPSYREI